MNRVNESEGELKRRRKVAMEKIMGAIIESIERVRKHPLVHSIAFRLLSLYQSIYMFSLTVKKMGSIVDPLRVKTPSFTVEQVNLLIETYNSIIRDIHSHLAKKDSYVCLLYTSPSPRDLSTSRMPSSA